MIGRDVHLHLAGECGMGVAHSHQFELPLHQRTCQGGYDLRGLVIVPVNVPTNPGPGQEFHIVAAAQKPDIVNLRDSRRKELEGAGDQILGFPTAQRIQKSAVHLIQIQVVGRRSGCLPALAPASLMNYLDQVVDLGWLQQPRISARIGTHIFYRPKRTAAL